MNATKLTIANELHAPARRNFERRKVFMKGIDETWQADLVDMQKYSQFNKGFKYLLTVIDNLSKFAWAIPLKNKSGDELQKSFQKLFSKGRIPKNLHVDQGTEFYNQKVKRVLESKKINLYSTFSEKKASICKRFNRTLKTKMWKTFTAQGSYKWVDILPKLLREYNNTIHRTIKVKPIDVTKNNETDLLRKLNKKSQFKPPKFRIGDCVRISKFKTIFEKGYTPNWSTEIFTIHEIKNTQPITYTLKDYQGNLISGGFYNFELLKVKYPDVYLIEKIIKRRGNEVYVKWLGFSNEHNQWIKQSDL